MDPLRLSVLGGTTSMALTPALVIPRAQAGSTQGTAATAGVQEAFLQALQAASALSGSGTASPTAATQGVTDSLLAALTAPTATAATTATADTPTAAAAVAPARPAVALAGATPATPVIAAAEAAATPQVALPDSSSLAFALETALRFGAGVAPGAAPIFQLPDAGAGLMRDAAAVPRQPHLLLNTGRSGAEVLAQPQTAAPQAVNAYRTAAVAEPPAGLDLMA